MDIYLTLGILIQILKSKSIQLTLVIYSLYPQIKILWEQMGLSRKAGVQGKVYLTIQPLGHDLKSDKGIAR